MPNPITLLGAGLKCPPAIAIASAETNTPGDGPAKDRINNPSPIMPIPAGTGGGTCQANRGTGDGGTFMYVTGFALSIQLLYSNTL